MSTTHDWQSVNAFENIDPALLDNGEDISNEAKEAPTELATGGLKPNEQVYNVISDYMERKLATTTARASTHFSNIVQLTTRIFINWRVDLTERGPVTDLFRAAGSLGSYLNRDTLTALGRITKLYPGAEKETAIGELRQILAEKGSKPRSISHSKLTATDLKALIQRKVSAAQKAKPVQGSSRKRSRTAAEDETTGLEDDDEDDDDDDDEAIPFQPPRKRAKAAKRDSAHTFGPDASIAQLAALVTQQNQELANLVHAQRVDFATQLQETKAQLLNEIAVVRTAADKDEVRALREEAAHARLACDAAMGHAAWMGDKLREHGIEWE